MSGVGLTSHINSQFIKELSHLSRAGKDTGKSIANAFRGGASESSISSSLRAGAQRYTKSVGGLNFAISFVNVADADLKRFNALTEEMIQVAEAATTAKATQTRKKLNTRFSQLAKQFKEIRDSSKVGDRSYDSFQDLSEILSVIGLKKKESTGVKEVLESFSAPTSEQTIASLDIKGKRPVSTPKGVGEPSAVHDTDDLFSPTRTLLKRRDAYAVLADLKALHEQIQVNRDAIDKTRDFLGENVQLVRATGLAMLELSDHIQDDVEASDVAHRLQQAIRSDPQAATAQAENLEPLLVAALTITDNALLGQ